MTHQNVPSEYNDEGMLIANVNGPPLLRLPHHYKRKKQLRLHPIRMSRSIGWYSCCHLVEMGRKWIWVLRGRTSIAISWSFYKPCIFFSLFTKWVSTFDVSWFMGSFQKVGAELDTLYNFSFDQGRPEDGGRRGGQNPRGPGSEGARPWVQWRIQGGEPPCEK